MWINGLVATITDVDRRTELVRELDRRVEFDVGEFVGPRVPLVMLADDAGHSRELHEWLESRPGVLVVDLAFAGFESGESETAESGTDAPLLDRVGRIES